MKPTLEFVKEITADAGDILQRFVGEDLDVKHKSRVDLVTKADNASEEYIIGRIREAFPGHAINAEESGEWEGDREHQWFIDPLDGTLNYAHGVPFYAVSIGYAFQGEMTLGVVYDPVRGEFFCAEQGKGVTLNGKPIMVSPFTDLVDCMLATGFPFDQWRSSEGNVENFVRFSELSQAVRRMGSASLHVAYVAAGRLDGFWDIEIFQWDVAAAGLMVREAGGVVTNLRGAPDFLAKPVSIVCANPIIHAKMLAVLAEVRGAQNQ